jgi:5-methylcytosine-specific restriction endonuclease McrA
MREPRPGARWSTGRLARRQEYLSWTASAAWRARRRAWLAEWRARYDGEPACVVCDAPWRLGDGDLHHICYLRLGAETFVDLWPICRACHEALHLIRDATPAWRALGREAASAGIVAALRQCRFAGAVRDD